MSDTQQGHTRSRLTAVFMSPEEPRLRAGWRLLIQASIQAGLTFGLGLCLALTYLVANRSIALGNAWDWVLNEAVEMVTVVVSVWIARRFLDGRSFGSLGLQLSRRTLVDLGVGAAISAVLMGMIFLAEWSSGWLQVTGFAWQADSLTVVASQTLLFLIVFVLGGFNEELMSRGYHLQTIASGMTPAWGIILSSAIFSALHAANPHATWISTAGIFGAGLFFGLAFLWTGQLWLPIGIHLAWNFFEGIVFGFPVSGLDMFPLIHSQVAGPELWTGGAFGPEAGLIVVPALLIGTALIFLYSRVRAGT